ncbi:MAG: peptidoglycan DD-metalloendopeptidase family protein [Anaerolineae bacterium]|nr:peptidoglycan DD-metalloendopeptidase family protein [Anaerolineae bacterium]
MVFSRKIMRWGRRAVSVTVLLSILLSSQFFTAVPAAHAQDENLPIPSATSEQTNTEETTPTETPTETESPIAEEPPLLETPTAEATDPPPEESSTPEESPTPEFTPTLEPTLTPESPTPEEPTETPAQPAWQLLADGTFVYGPQLDGFDLAGYLAGAGIGREAYADVIFGRSQVYSFNPKVMLAAAEVASGWVSSPDADPEQPFALGSPGFDAELDQMAEVMVDAYYQHLYGYSAMDPATRELPTFTLADGSSFQPAGETNAGTYALIAGLALSRDAQSMLVALDPNLPEGFYQTYLRLFGEDPLAEINHVPGSGLRALAAPSGMLQLPYAIGDAWGFGGVHGYTGSGTDMSSIDFYTGVDWGGNTSAMWVTAAAAGTVKSKTNCYVEINHGGGWSTSYYHLENVQVSTGASVNINDNLAVIANTLPEATCNGGSSTGPHVHFTLRYNGAYYPLDSSDLSRWVIHSGRSNYDTNCDYMYLTRDGEKRCPFSTFLINDGGVSGGGSGSFIPVLDSITPSAASTGDSDVVLTAYGSNFVSSARIRWHGTELTTTYVSNSEVRATIAASRLEQAGTYDITVYNPVPGGGSSNVLPFTVSASNRCAPATTLTLGSSHTYKNYSTNSHYWMVDYAGWAKDMSGPEYAYRFTAPMTGTLVAELSSVTTGKDLDVFVLDGSGECHSSNLIGGGEDAVQFNAQAGHPYYLVVDGANGSQASFTIKVKMLNQQSVYAPAEGSNPDNLRPAFEWQAVAGATSYSLYVSTSPSFSKPIISKTVYEPFYQPISDISGNRPIYWRVIARSGSVRSEYSQTMSFFSANPPSKPSLYAPKSGSLVSHDTAIDLDWKDSSNYPTYYELQVATASTFEPGDVIWQESFVPQSAYTLATDLAPDTRYYWRVRSYNQEGQYSAWSSYRYFRTRMLTPTLVMLTDGVMTDSLRPSFDWEDVPGATAYYIKISAYPTFKSAISVKVYSSEYTLTKSLSANRMYYWKVYAYGSNPSLYSDVRTFTTPYPPSVPSPVAPSSKSVLPDWSPTLDWKDSTNLPDSYLVQLSTSKYFDQDVITYQTADSQLPVPEPLTPNRTYFWRVSSYHADGVHSTWSSYRYFRTRLEAPEPLAPVEGLGSSGLRPTFDWTDVPEATAYVLKVSTSPSFSSTLISVKVYDSQYLSSKTLTAGRTYYWKVYAYGTVSSLYSPVTSFVAE